MKKLAAILILCCMVLSTAVFAQSQLDKGKELLNQGKAKEAIAVLREFLATNPKSVDAWLLLGSGYFNISNLDSAKVAGNKVISLDETNVNGYLLVEKIQKTQKDFQSAYNTLKAGLAEKKDDSRLLTELGYLLMEADSVDRAIVVLTQAKEADPNSAVVYEGLGDAYSKRVTAFAITQYEKSIELDSTKAEVHNKLGKLYYKERRYNDAAREYLHVATLDTANEAVLLELARMYMVSRPKQYANAARTLKLFVQRFPNSEEVWPTYVEALYYTRQYAEAVKAAQRVLKSDPKSAHVLRFLASSHSELKQYNESIESYNKLRALDTLKISDLKDLANAYTELKKDTLTLQTYEEIVNLDPNQKEIFNRMGTILMSWKKWDRAAIAFQKCFTLDSTAYGAFLNFALCNMVLERADTARMALRYVTSKRPEYAPGHLYLARSLTATDSLQAAKKEYEEWLKLTPPQEEAKFKRELAEAYKIIGASYLLEKKYPPTIENLNRSVKYRDDDWQPHLWLGQAHQLSGNKEEAIKEYQKVLKLNPKNKDAKDALERMGIPVD